MFPFFYALLNTFVHRMPLPPGKLATAMAKRRSAAGRWLEWGSSNRTAGPLVWVHGASVGEGLTALPIIQRLKTVVPALQLIHSFTSPSVEAWKTVMETETSDYLPLDHGGTLDSVFSTVRPSLIVCSRGDLWPAFALTAGARGIPIAIVSGTVRKSSARLRAPVVQMMKPVYRTVSWLGAATSGDAERWTHIGVPENVVTETGDTRHDQVLERPTRLEEIRPLLVWSRGKKTLVAGSTDERDEEIILKSFRRVLASCDDARLIIAPHECNDERIGQIVGSARSIGVEFEVWRHGSADLNKRFVILAKMGMLADTYSVGQIAYVGGGFKRGGLHAVVEPAAWALPVVIGPFHHSSADAGSLLEAGGAISLAPGETVEQLSHLWTEWLENEDGRFEAGLNARRVLQRGAANKTAAELVRLLDRFSHDARRF